MPNSSYLDRIDQLISETQRRLTKLIDARDVLMEVGAREEPEAEESKPTFRTAPFQGKELKPPKAEQPSTRAMLSRAAQKEDLKRKIVNALALDPQTSTSLIAKIFPNADKSDKQSVYDVMYALNTQGIVRRDTDRTYYLVKSPQSHHANVPNETEKTV